MTDGMGIPLRFLGVKPSCGCWTKVDRGVYRTPPNGLTCGSTRTSYEYFEKYADEDVDLDWELGFSFCPVCGKKGISSEEPQL